MPTVWGVPRAETFSACARFKFGDGRLGVVRCAADSLVGIAGSRGKFAGNCVLSRRCYAWASLALVALCGRLGIPCDSSTWRKLGVDIPSKLHCAAHCVLSVAPFGRKRSESVMGPTFSASYFAWAFRRNVQFWPTAFCAFVTRGAVCITWTPRAPFSSQSSNVRGRGGFPFA